MPRRSIWSARQRAALFDLPTDEAALLRHYTLSDDDIEQIRVRRGGHNRLGFALQLCAFRYPGRLLVAGEAIPLNVLRFIAAQLGMRAEDPGGYAVREETRREHLAEIRRIYGYRMFSGRCARDLKVWLENEAEAARSNEGLARRFVEECRRRQVILPGLSILERLCAGALVAAERRIETRIAAGLDDAMRMRLDRLLTEEVDGGVSRFVWLRRFEVGRNSADINGLLDRLEFLQGFDLPSDLLETVPPHRIARLRRQGERYFTDGLRDISGDRRLAILAVCAVEWRGAIADAVVETHDRIVGQTFRSAQRRSDARIQDSRTVLRDTLASFRTLGAALLEAKGDGAPLEEAVAAAGGWQKLEGVVAAAEQLSDTMSADPLAHVVQGWPRFRRYAPRMLRTLEIQASGAGEPILAALRAIGGGSRDMPRTFLRRNSRWHQHLNARPAGDRRLWEVAALFHMRDAFRSGDVWLAHSRRYGDVKRALAPIEAAHATARLAVPFEAREWLAERKAGLVEGLDRLADAAHHGRIPGGAIENGELRIGRPASAVPEDVDELVLDLYRRLPEVRITDILLEVDAATGFTDAFTHLRTGAPCKDRIGLLNVLLAEGLNLGLSKMAEASNTHDFFQLSRLSRWHIESEAIDRALAMVIEAQAQLPMARLWSLGLTASSDGQFFPAARQGEAMNLVNARYGSEPGLKAYTHVSDRFGPFATQTIPATVNEPAAAKVRGLSAPARTGRHSPRNRTGRTNALHRRLAARRRYAAPGQHRPEQGRGSSRAQERAPDRTPGRNPRPLERGPTLPHGRAQPARRHRHLLEYRPSRRSGQTAETRRPDGRARAPGPHLTPWVGPHPAHWRIPVAKTPIADLAYDPAPYRSRPVAVDGDPVMPARLYYHAVNGNVGLFHL